MTNKRQTLKNNKKITSLPSNYKRPPPPPAHLHKINPHMRMEEKHAYKENSFMRMEENIDVNEKKRAREPSESDFSLSSPEVKRIRDDLLEDDEDGEANVVCTTSEVLIDSFVKSFEDELISAGDRPSSPVSCNVDTANEEERQPELGFLFEASDDELGLPPCEEDAGRVSEDDGFGFGFGDDIDGFGQVDGLFDYPDFVGQETFLAL